MNASFTYSLLQYRHSLWLGEAINVGILFQFPREEKIEFVAGNAHRLKAIYPDFDQTVFNYLIKSIEKKLIEVNGSLFSSIASKSDLKKYIHSSILPEDATALQFKDPVSVVNTIGEPKNVIQEFSTLLLPGIIAKKSEIIRHNENFLIRRYVGYIFEKDKSVDKKLERNKTIKANINQIEIELKFDLAWQNGSTNLIKPLSFDLADEQSIQNKSTQYFGYLNLLANYAKEKNLRFDFLVSKPQNNDLIGSYESALGILAISNAPKRIITENNLQDYSEETIKELLSH